MNKPEVFVTFAPSKFDGKSALTDETAKELIRKLLESLVAWTKALKRENG